jgi:hypothetical protein
MKTELVGVQPDEIHAFSAETRASALSRASRLPLRPRRLDVKPQRDNRSSERRFSILLSSEQANHARSAPSHRPLYSG